VTTKLCNINTEGLRCLSRIQTEVIIKCAHELATTKENKKRKIRAGRRRLATYWGGARMVGRDRFLVLRIDTGSELEHCRHQQQKGARR
jgi:hypothetical protein